MKPQNVLYIISDQHNRDTLGCYGDPVIRTPNLDALAERGTRFTSAYTNCPICVPARASLATGRYVHDIGYWDNAFPYEGAVKGWGHRLQEEGRRCESIGKLHYRDAKDDDGFAEHHIPLNVVDGIGDVFACLRQNQRVRLGSRKGITEAHGGESTYLDYDRKIADHTIAWLEERAADPDDQPWVLFSSFVCPHPPFIGPKDYFDYYYDHPDLPIEPVQHGDDRPTHPAMANMRRIMQCEEPFTEEELRHVTAAYYASTNWLDTQVGRVLDALRETGIEANTRVVYTTDHGEHLGRRGLFGKFTMYEESAAVPLILAGDDVPTGCVCDSPVSLVDSYQTILEGAGVSLTEQEQAELPGDSLWAIANGAHPDRAVFSEYHAIASENGAYMLRRGRYKLIYHVHQPAQLFDLRDDPLETTDLADSPEHADVLADLERQLRAICDPEAVDARAKADQAALIERHGGEEAVVARGTFLNSPAPGEAPKMV
ncbi:MAG: sulfatase-like hydrolase/transferase [Planctomycetota bacterium]|jgi:choline-sulfatase